MTKSTFFLLLVLLAVVFAFRDKILGYDKQTSSMFKSVINYIFAFALVVLIVLGFLIVPNTKTTFSNTSDAYNDMRESPANKRPHKYFDINTYE
ncbi:MAG TPA: hypothetical protein EYG73_13085 [Arcobacter sp.]|nr:hypothetical protein [Arcobacter sp.]